MFIIKKANLLIIVSEITKTVFKKIIFLLFDLVILNLLMIPDLLKLK